MALRFLVKRRYPSLGKVEFKCHPPFGRVGRRSGRGGVRVLTLANRFFWCLKTLPARSSRPSQGEGGKHGALAECTSHWEGRAR